VLLVSAEKLKRLNGAAGSWITKVEPDVVADQNCELVVNCWLEAMQRTVVLATLAVITLMTKPKVNVREIRHVGAGGAGETKTVHCCKLQFLIQALRWMIVIITSELSS